MKKQESRFIDVENIVDNDDGSATMTISMDDDTSSMLLREGIRLAMPKKYRNKIMVIPPDDIIDPKIKTVELPEDEINCLIELAIIDMLRKYIKNNSKKDKKV